ncbi:MAG: two-component sensor histidine kinase [Chloroflexi bacterium]|nr:two-component sensor histidine kinase [Chloroflexota bacterium]
MPLSTIAIFIAMILTAGLAIFMVVDAHARVGDLQNMLGNARRQLAARDREHSLLLKTEELQKHLPVGLALIASDERIVLQNDLASKLLHSSIGGAATLADLAGSPDVIKSVRQAVHQRRSAAGVIVPEPGHFVEVSAHPLDSGDTLLVLHDVSELRHLRTIRRDFVANVSHELRTPLASIRLLVDTLEAGALDDVDVAAGFVHRIGVEADQLIQMVNELLELARMESGQVPFRREPVPVADLVEQAVSRLSVVAEDRGIHVSTDLDEPLPDVLADRDQAVQVLLNLMFNAIKFTPEGGSVHIQASHRDQHVAIAVIDTGVGIHRDDLSRIFERFYKSDKSRVRSRGGTGLGLPIARHIVEAHGGNIWAESKEGQGSTFTFTLPTTSKASEHTTR